MDFDTFSKKDQKEMLRLIRSQCPESDEPFFRLDATITEGDADMDPMHWHDIADKVRDGHTQGDIRTTDGNLFWSIEFGCRTCGSGDFHEEACPFQSDVNGNDTPCRCCTSCRNGCAMEI